MKNLFKWVLMSAMVVGTPLLALAQSRTITGTVRDASGPIIGASVVVKDAPQVGMTTDANGAFTLSVPGNAVALEISYLGYTTQEVSIVGRDNVTVVLAEDLMQLDEVVVIGYGTARRRDLTGATASVSGADLASVPVATAAQAIAGKLAGVNVVTQSGAPGADVNITVRGGTSITQSTKPLYVVDGFQMEDGLKFIDINDIETIDVMKDASATAIYGARGSNGVILITTKSGKSGKTTVSYNGYVSFEKLGRTMDLMNAEEFVNYQYEFMALRQQLDAFPKYFGGGSISDPSFYSGAAGYIHNTYGNRREIDWQDIVFGGTATMQNHNVSITGGSDKTNFILSYNHTNQDGIIDKYGYTKNNVRAKIDHQVRDWLRVDLNSNFNNIKTEGNNSLGGVMRGTMLMPATEGTLFTRDELINTSNFYNEALGDFAEYRVYNPLILNDAVTRENLIRQFSVNAGVTIDLPFDLTWRTSGSYFWQHQRTDTWDDGRTPDATQSHNSQPWGSRNNSERFNWQITNTLNWAQQYGKHGVNVLLGQEVYESESMKLDNTYDGFSDINFGLNNLTGANSYSRASDLSTNRMLSVFGRVMYNYDDRYLLTATLRNDGSSKFAKDKQWGLLPSASAAWRLSEEDFVKDLNIFDQLKLRVGYGVTGNANVDNYMYTTAYGSSKYTVNNQLVAALAPGSKLGNEDLGWEKTASTNVGLDISVLGSRVNLSVDWYNQQSNNLLLEAAIPTHTGFSTQFQNVGEIRNRGWEFVLNTRNIVGEFSWTTDFNIAFNRSKVLKLYGDVDFLSLGDNFRIYKNKPMHQFYGYIYDGVFTTDDFNQNPDGSYTLKDGVARPKTPGGTIKPGDVKYKPTTGETDANGNPVWSDVDRTSIGSALPKFTGGMVNTFTYKGIDLSVFMSFTSGNKVFNKNKQQFMGPYVPMVNAFSEMADRFTLIDPSTGLESTNLARLADLNPGQHSSSAVWSLQPRNQSAYSTLNSYYLEDGSFLRINTITLGYTLPQAWAKKAQLGSVRVYATLNNPFTFTKYEGYDPEVSKSDKIADVGFDDSSYPRAKSFVIGLNLTF